MPRIRRPITALLVCLLISSAAIAQEQPAVPLWASGAPGARGQDPKDVPTLTPFVSPTAPENGGTIVILPGGGYVNLAAHEGSGFAQYFMARGVTTFVLKYRLGRDGYRHPSMLQDAARAVRYLRANAATYKIDPNKIGIMGSSAGGHLASTILTHFDAGDATAADPIDKLSSRPDFGILCYPVITMTDYTHNGSKQALLGPQATPELVQLLSNELQVTKETPPTFIWHGVDDRTVPVRNSTEFAQAMWKAGASCELHVYEKAAHGIGLGNRAAPFEFHPWVFDMNRWLGSRGIRIQQAPATQPAAPALAR